MNQALADNIHSYCKYNSVALCISDNVCVYVHPQRVVGGVLDGSSKEWSPKEAQLMVASIQLLTGTLELGSQEVGRAYYCHAHPLFTYNYSHRLTKCLSGHIRNVRTTTLVCNITPHIVSPFIPPPTDDPPLTKALISLFLITAERRKSSVKMVCY